MTRQNSALSIQLEPAIGCAISSPALCAYSKALTRKRDKAASVGGLFHSSGMTKLNSRLVPFFEAAREKRLGAKAKVVKLVPTGK